MTATMKSFPNLGKSLEVLRLCRWAGSAGLWPDGGTLQHAWTPFGATQHGIGGHVSSSIYTVTLVMLRPCIDGLVCKLANYIFINFKTSLLSQCSISQCWWSLYQNYQGCHRIWFMSEILLPVHQQKISIFNHMQIYANLCKLCHVTTKFYFFLYVSVIDLQMYQHSHRTNIAFHQF